VIAGLFLLFLSQTCEPPRQDLVRTPGICLHRTVLHSSSEFPSLLFISHDANWTLPQRPGGFCVSLYFLVITPRSFQCCVINYFRPLLLTVVPASVPPLIQSAFSSIVVARLETFCKNAPLCLPLITLYFFINCWPPFTYTPEGFFTVTCRVGFSFFFLSSSFMLRTFETTILAENSAARLPRFPFDSFCSACFGIIGPSFSHPKVSANFSFRLL